MSSQPFRARSLPLLLLLFVAGVNGAEEPYYTWVDENGVVNFSEQNPKNVDAIYVTKERRFGEVVETPVESSRRPGKVATPEPPPPTEAEAAQEDGGDNAPAAGANPALDAQMAAERAAVEAEIAKARASNCAMAKRNLARLEAYARIRVREADGSERVLSDAEKAERIATAQNTIAENCGPGK